MNFVLDGATQNFDKSRYNMFILFIMSHGGKNLDGKEYLENGILLDDIIEKFANHPNLAGVKKWLNFDCCRGTDKDVVRIEPVTVTTNAYPTMKVTPWNELD